MAEFLFRRNGRYSYRRRYPKEIATILGRTEFVQALGTSDPAEAARRSRCVTVQFDEQCAEALANVNAPMSTDNIESASETNLQQSDRRLPQADAEYAAAILASLPGVMRTITMSVIAEQGRNPRGWRDDIAWRKKAAQAHIDGTMPPQIQMHPAQAQAALKALELLEAGNPVSLAQYPDQRPVEPVQSPSAKTGGERELTLQVLQDAFVEYGRGKSGRRVAIARRCAEKCIQLPCSMGRAKESMSEWCAAELKKKKASSVWTEISAVIALLKLVPGWHDFIMPKIGELRSLKGAGKASKDAKAPIPVPMLRDALKGFARFVPNKGEHWHAAITLCSLYGFRPGELLQSGEESLVQRPDIMGKTRLVFRIGLQGAKNSSSKRDVPVTEAIEPIFRLALRAGSCASETARTRVERLNGMLRQALGTQASGLSLYSIRHTFADVARECGYSDSEFGPIMGHTGKGGTTGVYGGMESLDKQAEIIAAIQHKLFPEGLNTYLPIADLN